MSRIQNSRERLASQAPENSFLLHPGSTFALSGLERGCLGSAARPVRPSGRVGRRCAPVKGVGFLRDFSAAMCMLPEQRRMA